MKPDGVLAVLPYNRDMVNSCKNMEEFYQKTGVYPYIKSGKVSDVQQIHISKENNEKFLDQMQNFAHNRAQSLAISMDWLRFSPVSHTDFPADQIIILESGKNWREFFDQEKDSN